MKCPKCGYLIEDNQRDSAAAESGSRQPIVPPPPPTRHENGSYEPVLTDEPPSLAELLGVPFSDHLTGKENSAELPEIKETDRFDLPATGNIGPVGDGNKKSEQGTFNSISEEILEELSAETPANFSFGGEDADFSARPSAVAGDFEMEYFLSDEQQHLQESVTAESSKDNPAAKAFQHLDAQKGGKDNSPGQ